jgi:hypothetical protein
LAVNPLLDEGAVHALAYTPTTPIDHVLDHVAIGKADGTQGTECIIVIGCRPAWGDSVPNVTLRGVVESRVTVL